MKLGWLSVQKNVQNQQNYIQTNCPSVALMLFKSIGIKLRQFVWKKFWGVGILPVGDFLIARCDTDATNKHSLCSNELSVTYPLILFLLFQDDIHDVRHIYRIFLLPWFVYLHKILRMRRWQILSSQVSVPWQSLERQREIIVWSSAQREIYLQTDN